MFVSATFRLPDGTHTTLGPGAIIGRMRQAALRFDDPRISEAHALVSLRGAELRLLALRGKLSVDGKPKNQVRLTPGARLVLGGYLALVVTDVVVPAETPTIVVTRGDVRAAAPLEGVLAIHARPGEALGLSPGFDPAALVTVWPADEGVRVRVNDAAHADDYALAPDDALTLGALTVRFELAARAAQSAVATIETGRFEVALTFVIHYDTVHIRTAEGTTVVIDGLGARLLSELALLRTPVAWSELAKALWDDEDDHAILRQRWDQATSRLRKKLQDGKIRTDLVRANRSGLVELFLGEHDRVEDLS